MQSHDGREGEGYGRGLGERHTFALDEAEVMDRDEHLGGALLCQP